MRDRDLKEKIRSRECRVAVIGLGYVGLPTAAIIADKGFRVVGVDLKESLVARVNSGTINPREPGLGKLVRKVVEKGMLRATTHAREAVKDSDVVLVVVQTPLKENKTPNLEALEKACTEVAGNLRENQLVIIESTIPPGAMRERVKPLLESGGLRAGLDFYLVYSPERAMPTRTLVEIPGNARLIGGINQESAHVAKEFYRVFVKGELLLASVETVEVVKLIENTYRDVNIALANEIARLCEALGVDAMEAIELANRHPRVNIHRPGAGVGGHCIPKDPYFLLREALRLGVKLEVVEAARQVNEAMPRHVVRLVEKALESVNKRVEESKIAVLGVAYKGETDDTRGTPAREVIEELLRSKSYVCSHDPYVQQDFGGEFSNDLEEVLRGADCVVVVTDHNLYKSMNPGDLAKNLSTPCVVVDARRVLEPREVEEQGLSYFGVGYWGQRLK